MRMQFNDKAHLLLAELSQGDLCSDITCAVTLHNRTHCYCTCEDIPLCHQPTTMSSKSSMSIYPIATLTTLQQSSLMLTWMSALALRSSFFNNFKALMAA